MRTIIAVCCLFLGACANADYGGVNYGMVVGPNGETWKVISGKDESNVRLVIRRGDVTAEYSAETSNATEALKAALETSSATIAKLAELLTTARP